MKKSERKQKNGLTFCNFTRQRKELCEIVNAYIENVESIWNAKIILTKYDKLIYGERKTYR